MKYVLLILFALSAIGCGKDKKAPDYPDPFQGSQGGEITELPPE